MPRRSPLAAAIVLVAFWAGWCRAEAWWRAYTPVVSFNGGDDAWRQSGAGAVRNVGYPTGWYGYWHVDDQKQHGHGDRTWAEAGRLGLKRIIYFDSGEVGDYAGFFTADGRMPYNGWSLPWWKGEPVTARWFGLAAFMADADWAPFPTAKHYGLPKFTSPDGSAADDLYAVLARRNLAGQWKFDDFSNPRVTDDVAKRSGLAAISGRQQSGADVSGKTGWNTVRLVNVDFADPQLRDYRCHELARMIEMLRPDGVHVDNHGDACVLYPQATAFGLWSIEAVRRWMAAHVSPQRLAAMGIADLAAFDIRRYLREKRFGDRRTPGNPLHDPRWAEDAIWGCYRVALIEASLDHHRAVYRAGKEAARRAGIDCLISGNTIPVFPGSGLMRGACDLVHFEWKTAGSLGPMRGAGLPPDGRVAYVTRVGAAIGDAGYCWPSLYVPQNFSGPGHENLHKVLAFDCLANRGILDFGHAYLDGYSPGTAASAGDVNRFIRAHAFRWQGRRYLADVGLVYCHWSQIAATTIVMPLVERAFNEYAGWASFLEHTHRQWEVVLGEDLTAEQLKRFPVVVLPAVLVLSERQAAELARYVAGGGRLVATGETGTRMGPEDYLQVRRENALVRLKGAPGVRVVAERPGAGYWGQQGATNSRLAELASFPGCRPLLETNAPATVGVHANVGGGAGGPIVTIDLVNHDVDPATDRLTPAPPCTLAIRLPAGLRGQKLAASWIEPGESGGGASGLTVDQSAGTITIQAGGFSHFRSYQVEPPAR